MLVKYSRTSIISPATISQTSNLSTKGLRRDLYLIKNPKNPEYITHFEMKNPHFITVFGTKKGIFGAENGIFGEKNGIFKAAAAVLASF